MKIQLKRSNVLDGGTAKEPPAAQMEFGELAVNYNETDPAIFMKDADGNIIRIAGANGNIESPGSGGTPHQPGTLDDRYVEVTGDTMTGQLTLPGGGGATQALQKQEIEALPVSTFNNDSGYITLGEVPTPDLTPYVEKAGDNMTGDLTLGTLPASPAISLKTNGSATFALDATIHGVTVGRGGGSVNGNTAVGSAALSKNTTGDFSTALGRNALNTNTTGSFNTALGNSALNGNTEGGNNTAVGNNALGANTTGGSNAALGVNALNRNTTGSNNTAVGVNALTTNTEGDANTALGREALQDNTEGKYNTAVGWQALRNNTTGTNNTAVGYTAGYYIEGSNNTILGAYKGTTADATLSDTVIISAGATARLRINSTGNLLFGGTLPSAPNITLNANGSSTFAADATIHGLTVGRGGSSMATNTAVGENTLANNTGVGGFNTAVGHDALTSSTQGSFNTAIGNSALTANTKGASNTAVGRDALKANTEGESNTALGRQALHFATTGKSNTAVGRDALLNNTTGSANIGIGGLNLAGNHTPVFNVTTEDNRIVMGSTSITDAYVQVAWTVTSDARDKTSFAPVPYGLDFVKQLQPTAYQFKAGSRNARDPETNELIPVTAADELPSGPIRYGFKAQDILALEGDNPVIIDNEDPEHLKYRGEALVPVLVNAIKEQQVLIDALTARLDAAGA